MWARGYWFAWGYLGCFVLAEGCYALLSPGAAHAVLALASTSVANISHDPFGCLVLSAFISGGNAWAWPVLIGVALLSACRVAGSERTFAACVLGHVVGTLVSEGIVAWRVHVGSLPRAYLHLTDVGPSYVAVSALVVALVAGWPRRIPVARVAAAVGLVILVFPCDIFGGLGRLQVAAVGHLTAMLTAGCWIAVSGYVAHPKADEIGDSRGSGAQHELPDGAAPERPGG